MNLRVGLSVGVRVCARVGGSEGMRVSEAGIKGSDGRRESVC